MQATTQSQQKAVSSHVADNESIEAGRADSEEVFVVTDSRILSMKDTTKDGHSVRTIQSTNLSEGVRGVEIEETKPKSKVEDALILSGISVVGGLVSFYYAFTNTSEIAMLIGVVCIIAGAILVYDGFDTPDGEIKVEITTDAGTDTYWLREDDSEIAAAVSEIIGENSRL